MQKVYQELREHYPVFTYEKYAIDQTSEAITITYTFHIDGLETFTPTWRIPNNQVKDFNPCDPVLRNIVFHLGLVELISYWKLTCSNKVLIKAGYLNSEQQNWWKVQYYYGLGEFFYVNDIETSFEDFMIIESNEDRLHNRSEALHELSGCLIPVGGGKDSAVTMELIKDIKDQNMCYIINSREATRLCCDVAGYQNDQVISVHRSLDKRMIKLNKQGYLNGHTPFSAIVAFSSVLAAYLNKKRYVVLSNESSANESTVQGTLINHQYSKSFQFERDFCEYEKKYINTGVHYFSLLRPFSEFQIARYFAKHQQYFKVFKSCNVGSKLDCWCGHCSKCLFVYLILSPFVSQVELQGIFGVDLLNQSELIDTFEKLIGHQNEKPFECVGTRDELNFAICLTLKQMEEEDIDLPLLFQHYKQLPVYTIYRDQSNPYWDYFNDEHLAPIQLIELVKNKMIGE